MTDCEFEIWEDDEMFARVSSAERDRALAEAGHYAAQCDGKVRIYEVKRTLVLGVEP